jgi:competence protein ComEC
VKDPLLAYDDFLEIIKNKDISTFEINGFESIKMGENCNLKIIYPFNNISKKEFDNLNNSSIVSRLDCADKTFLFTGDIEEEMEEKILNSDINIKSDIIKVAHHGSDTSNTEKFLDLVSPELAVIQSGEGNSFGHPSLRVIKRLERGGTQILRNDIKGTIELKYKID